MIWLMNDSTVLPSETALSRINSAPAASLFFIAAMISKTTSSLTTPRMSLASAIVIFSDVNEYA